MTTFVSLVFALSFSFNSQAEERPGKAVYEYSAENGMKLTEKALKNIEVKTSKVNGDSPHVVVTDALVYFQDNVGVYRLRNAWFKLVKVKLVSKSALSATIQSAEIASGDEVAIHGADLLRVSEMDAAGGGE